MNNSLAQTLAILMEEMINQMVLLRHELERNRDFLCREHDNEIVPEEEQSRLIGGTICPSEVEV